MSDDNSDCTKFNNSDKIEDNLHQQAKAEDMPKEDRKRKVLEILTDSGFALPKAAIYRNAKLRGATFARRSVDNYLEEMAQEGLVQKVDTEALDEGRLVEVDLSQAGYFIATDAGYELLNDSE
jgi:Fe2+ or Zn2+ uptake regulation protein